MPVQNAALTGTRRLIVSNDPESIGDRLVKNLYGCKWSLPSGNQDFRLFLWHRNDDSGGARGAALPYNIQFSGLGSGPDVGPLCSLYC